MNLVMKTAPMQSALVKTTVNGATVRVVPAASGQVKALNGVAPSPLPSVAPKAGKRAQPAPKAKTPRAPRSEPSTAETRAYVIVKHDGLTRGAIFEAILALSGAEFTRADFCEACGSEVNAMRHFYWAKSHGYIVPAEGA